MNSRSRMKYLTVASAAILYAASAHAQVAPASSAATDQASTLEDIVVTARRTSERLQDVPVAVSAFSAEALESQAASSIRDLQGLVPNVTLDQTPVGNNQASFFIRGIGVADFERSIDPAVAVYVNDVYKPATVGTALDSFDIDSIQIVRGPQGTLFGKNTIGGAVLIQTTRPTGVFGGKTSLTAGSFGRLDFKALVNMPIIEDTLAFKIAGASFNDDGEVFNLASSSRVGGRSEYIIRPSLLFTPTENVEFLLDAEYYHNGGEQAPLQNISTPARNPLICITLNLCPGTSRHVVNVDDISPVTATYQSVSLRGKVDFGAVTLNLVTAYQDDEDSTYNDFDATPRALISADRIGTQQTFSQEVRLSTNPSFSEKLTLVGGLYYFNSEYTSSQRVDHVLQFSAGLPLGARTLLDAKQKTVDYAAFAQASYKLTDRLTATVGGRYTDEKKDFSTLAGTSLSPLRPAAAGSISEGKFTPHVDLSYRLTGDNLLFASWSQGFRSGGFNGRAGTPADIGPYASEIVDSYEIGSKNEFFDRHVRLNLSAFYSKYDNKQESISFFDPNYGALTVIKNAAGVNFWGLEAEATYVVNDRLMLRGSAGYLNAEYKGFNAALLADRIVTNNDDLRPNDTPEFTASFQPSYHFPLGSGEVFLTPSYRWTDEYWVRPDAQRAGDLRALYPAIGILDLVVSYEVPVNNTELRLSAFVRNATDEYTIRYQNSTAFGGLGGELPGRTWGVTLEAKF